MKTGVMLCGHGSRDSAAIVEFETPAAEYTGEKIRWRSPLEANIGNIAARRGRRVVVLASGDRLCYGVGALPRLAGLSEDCFLRDGRITRRAVRAVTQLALRKHAP